ncbi:unnamed protein product [Linum trigynum]|uniref:Secreted protein n=1 Tax=Linum trigynum TaxID=586398 RepID=A0AAV2CRH5_9ROSI
MLIASRLWRKGVSFCSLLFSSSFCLPIMGIAKTAVESMEIGKQRTTGALYEGDHQSVCDGCGLGFGN